MNYENISASYDVGIAKKYGVNCAALLNKLNYLCSYSVRNDGFCWRTAADLENELGLTRSQQELAIKKLEDAGIIETKNTYIIGTQVKCKHFKVLHKSDFKKTSNSDFKESSNSDLQETYKSVNNNNTLIINNNNKEKINKKERFKKPSLEEIEEYCKSRHNSVDAKKFFDYYEISNWKDKDGKQVKNWKQKVITWEGRRQVTKIENVPDWFNQDLKINKASYEEEKEMQNIINNY